MKLESSIRHTDGLLHVENSLFEQCWDLRCGVPQLIRFVLSGGEPLVDAAQLAGTSLEPTVAKGQGQVAQVAIERKQLLPTEAFSTNAYVRLGQPEDPARSYHFQVFDTVAGCVVRIIGLESGELAAVGNRSAEASHRQDGAAGGIEQDPPRDASSVHTGRAALDVAMAALLPITFARAHPKLTQVHFAEQSDYHSEFVFERTQQMHPSERSFKSDANLTLLADPATGDGMGFLLLAPSALVRSQWGSQAGCFVENSPPRINGIGSLARLVPTLEHYPLAVLGWEGGTDGATQSLHALQRALHTWVQGRDGLFLSNTWGDRGRGERINERFVLEEIAVAQRLGTDVVELDDGWQSGLTANTKAGESGVWDGFWASTSNFWEPGAAAFPNGIEAVIRAATEKNMQFGLWFAPDSSNDFANWEKDAEVLLNFWRRHGIRYFKLDAIKLETLRGEHNLYQMLHRVQEGSRGDILLDMDLTAEHRLTYWGSIGGSTLFLQNRYTDWSNYYPHQSLRALWSLSAYVLPSRLRLEVLNPERNAELYGADPLRPSAYPPEYLLAITLPASGLGWFEHGSLSERVLHAWAPLLSVWKQHREAWHAGAVRRIGSAPDGYSWSGFISTASGVLYLLVFRELNGSDTQTFTLPPAATAAKTAQATATQTEQTVVSQTAPATAAERLAGCGEAVLAGGLLRVTIPQQQHFLLARITH